MRIALIILIAIHGIIHFFGFLKAFGFAEFNALTQPISKTFGILWLTAFLMLAVTLILFSIQYDRWWIFGTLVLFISQFLIITSWSDAKFGTILNLVIFISVILAYSAYSFTKRVNAEIAQMCINSKTYQTTIITEEMIADLPNAVQKWLLNSGIIGKDDIHTVYLEQEAQMLMKPEQKEWKNAKAKQYFTVYPASFNWTVDLKFNSILNFAGRDKFENGTGEMTIKLLSLIPVVNEKNNPRINEATLQRYLAEIVWFPSAALQPYIAWEAIDDYSARATMTFDGTEGSGVFHFDESGNFKKFSTLRYKDKEDVEPKEWTVKTLKTEVLNELKVPVDLEVSWKLNGENWTWLKLKITDIRYNNE